MTLAADLASDLSAGGGEVTAKLNTDQWVVVSVYVHRYDIHCIFI